MSDLIWNDSHTINSQHKYCYCGKDRNLLDVCLQCRSCKDWFHAECTTVKSQLELLFITNYVFTCANCADDGKETFERTTASWKDIISTTIANLTIEQITSCIGGGDTTNDSNKELFESKNAHLMKEWHPEQYFFYKRQLVPYVDEHWHSLCTERSRTKAWWGTLGSCLYSNKDTFVADDERQRSAASGFQLIDSNLWHIRPYTSQMSGKLPNASNSTHPTDTTSHVNTGRVTEDRHSSHKQRRSIASPHTASHPSSPLGVSRSSSPFPPAVTPVKAPAKNNNTTNSDHSTAGRAEPSSASTHLHTNPTTTSTLITTNSNTDHPFNKFGFKYTPCEPSILPLIAYQQTDYKAYHAHPHPCVLSLPDKSPYVYVSKDGLTLTTEKGFRMCRANVGVKEGNWFWEAIIQKADGPRESSSTEDDKKDGPHVRVGFARREACLNAPVGYDGYSYGYRDKTGDRLFCSRPEKFGESFETGDVIGLYISLPSRQQQYENSVSEEKETSSEPPQKRFKSALRRRIPIAYKDHLWFEEKDYRPSKEMEALADPYRKKEEIGYAPKVLHGSFITVYKNGVNQGVMFTDLFDFEDFGRLPETILAKKAKKKRKYHKKDDQQTNAYHDGHHGVHGQKDDRDAGYENKYWTDDPPVEDDGTLGYYPAVSVYKGGTVTCNFGPRFRYPPTDQKEAWRPMCDRFDDYMAEECVWDILDEVSRSFKN